MIRSCHHSAMKNQDLLEQVQAKLKDCPDSAAVLQEKTGVDRTTVWRIKRGKGDPFYSKVRALAVHFRLMRTIDKQEA